MLGEVFYWLFNMSIVAAICGLPVLLLRRIKGIPRRFAVLFWIIPFIRLCVPVGLGSRYGLMALLSKYGTRTVTVYESKSELSFTMHNSIQSASSYFPIEYKTYTLKAFFEGAAFIWITVALAALFAFFIIYRITAREMSDARKLDGNVYISDKIRTPAVYGIIKPRIILPKRYKKSDLDCILMHERAHIIRGDNIIRTAALAVVCLHWFNPFAWLFLKLLYSDIELACDEAVIAKCNEAERKRYAHALVSSVEMTNVFASSFGGAKIKLRIKNILSYRRITWISSVGFATLIIIIAYILLTNAL